MTKSAHTARLAKTPARAVAGCPWSCAGPFCVFSTDLESPGQGAPARLGLPLQFSRLHAVPAIVSSAILSVVIYAGRVTMVALD